MTSNEMKKIRQKITETLNEDVIDVLALLDHANDEESLQKLADEYDDIDWDHMVEFAISDFMTEAGVKDFTLEWGMQDYDYPASFSFELEDKNYTVEMSYYGNYFEANIRDAYDHVSVKYINTKTITEGLSQVASYITDDQYHDDDDDQD